MQTQKVLSTSLSNTNLDANSFTKDGYLFAGWNTKSDGSGTSFVNQNPLSPVFLSTTELSITLYAQWSLIYKVVFDPNGGSGTMTAIETTEIAGKTLTANVFTRSGYVFDGWNTASDGTGSNFADGTALSTVFGSAGAVVTLYAKWVRGFDLSTHDISEFADYLSRTIDTTSADNEVVIRGGNLTTSDLRTLSNAIKSYKANIGKLDLSELQITELFNSGNGAGGTGVFQKITALKEVILPKTLVTLSEGAFAYCDQLEKVTMYEGLTTILWSAFANCPKLKSITIPDSVVFIAQTSFSDCYDLEEVIISKNSKLELIGCRAFRNCTSLKEIYIPCKVENLNNELFKTSVNSKDPSTSGSFEGCTALSKVFFENTLLKINTNCFTGCSALTDVYYSGSQEEWSSVIIGTGNDYLTSATMHYNYTE